MATSELSNPEERSKTLYDIYKTTTKSNIWSQREMSNRKRSKELSPSQMYESKKINPE